MTIAHHPSDTTLLAFAAGQLGEARELVVATHLATCPVCRVATRAFECLGGAGLEAETAVSVTPDALQRALQAIDQGLTAAPIAALENPSELPAPLRHYKLGVWRKIGRSLEWRPVVVPAAGGTRVFMLRARPGTRIPSHAHAGIEWTCVLQGAFRHRLGRFGVGDFDEADESVDHDPVVEEGEVCVCLVAMQGQIRLKGLIGRLLQPLVRIYRRRDGAPMLQFSYRGGERGALDIYRPSAKAGNITNAPVIVFFYGGRWQSGVKGWYRPIAMMLAARGYAVVVPDYRLYPSIRFPAFVEDGAKAIRWTRDHVADHGGDPHSIFVMGHSAGAYIAAMLACDPSWLGGEGLDPASDVAGMIGVAGPYDFLPLTDPALIDMFGGADRMHTQPIAFASGRKPPALLLTGATDSVVDAGNSIRMAAALRRFGNDAQDILYPRLGHFTILAGFAPIVSLALPLRRDLDAFIARVRAAPRRAAMIRSAVSVE